MKLGSRLHTFVGYILNFHQATHKSLIQKRVIDKVLRKRKIVVNTERENINTCAS